ncbi:MAG TPA: hypothetical protein VIG50_16415 [Vicinamibacteria bacterium]
MRRLLSTLAVFAALASPAAAGDEGAVALREGIALLEAGDLEQAASRLEAAVEQLGADPAPGRDLGTAHLYLAMVQLGRNQPESARAHMREAWTRRKGARLDARTFPPRVIALYDEVGLELRPKRAGTPTKTLVGVGAAAAGAGALVGSALGGDGAAAAAPPPPASRTSTVRVFNSDDVGRVLLNGQVLFEMGLGQDSGAVDVTSKLAPGANEVVFELVNAHGAISYGFEVRQGEAIVFQETCGLVLRVGCEDDRRFPSGIVRRYVYTLQGR